MNKHNHEYVNENSQSDRVKEIAEALSHLESFKKFIDKDQYEAIKNKLYIELVDEILKTISTFTQGMDLHWKKVLEALDKKGKENTLSKSLIVTPESTTYQIILPKETVIESIKIENDGHSNMLIYPDGKIVVKGATITLNKGENKNG